MSTNFLAEKVIPCIINNKIHATKQTYDVVDPHDPKGKLLYQVSCIDESDADAAVAAAAAAFPEWSSKSPMERREYFMKLKKLIDERIPEIAEIEFKETTSSKGWAQAGAGMCSGAMGETVSALTALRGENIPAASGQRTYLEWCPYGVVFGIAPWNAPFILGVRAVRDAIAAGNTVVFKTSEFSPKVHTAIGQLFIDAGFPPGVLNVVHIAPQDAAKLCEKIISHKAVGKVNFTGSTFVGSKIAEVCGRYLKPSVMELGGKAPFIVLPSANLDFAVSSALFGGFFHSGQICMSTDVILCHESVAKEFEKKLSEGTNKLKATPEGAPLRGVFTTRSSTRLDGLIKDATDKGAKVLAGTLEGRNHNVMQPVVLSDINDTMRVSEEESFGPLITIRTFTTDEQVLKIANQSDYGLSSAVFGDESHAWKIARKIQTGAVHINSATIHDDPESPHGGVKSSGWGRFNSVAGLREFSYSKIITITEPHMYPM